MLSCSIEPSKCKSSCVNYERRGESTSQQCSWQPLLKQVYCLSILITQIGKIFHVQKLMQPLIVFHIEWKLTKYSIICNLSTNLWFRTDDETQAELLVQFSCILDCIRTLKLKKDERVGYGVYTWNALKANNALFMYCWSRFRWLVCLWKGAGGVGLARSWRFAAKPAEHVKSNTLGVKPGNSKLEFPSRTTAFIPYFIS